MTPHGILSAYFGGPQSGRINQVREPFMRSGRPVLLEYGTSVLLD